MALTMATNNSVNKNSPEFIEENTKLKRLVSEIEYLLKNYKKLSPYPDVDIYTTSSDYDEGEILNRKKDSNRTDRKSVV